MENQIPLDEWRRLTQEEQSDWEWFRDGFLMGLDHSSDLSNAAKSVLAVGLLWPVFYRHVPGKKNHGG